MSEISLEDKLCKNLEDSCKKSYEAGQQSMQAEINQLKAQVIGQGQRFNDQNQKNADLEYKYLQVQKRVDVALDSISGEIAQCHVTEHNRNTNVGQKNTAFLIREKLQVIEEVLRGEHA